MKRYAPKCTHSLTHVYMTDGNVGWIKCDMCSCKLQKNYTNLFSVRIETKNEKWKIKICIFSYSFQPIHVQNT